MNSKRLKTNKVLSVFLIMLMLINSTIGGTSISLANGRISVDLDKTSVVPSDYVNVKVNYGGKGTKVSDGQRVEIDFTGSNAEFKLPNEPLPLPDGKGESYGQVLFEGNKAVIVFNAYAAGRDDVEASFGFYGQALYTGDKSQDGKGTIRVEDKTIEVNHKISSSGETNTVGENNNVYRKVGGPRPDKPKSVDWIFEVNSAQKKVSYPNEKGEIVIEDTLPDTMVWSEDSKNAYKTKTNLVMVDGDGVNGLSRISRHEKWTWTNYDKITNVSKGDNIEISIDGQKLKITIPAEMHDGRSYFSPVSGTSFTFRFTADIKDEVINNPDILEVENSSEIYIDGNLENWDIDEKDKEASAEIFKSWSMASGTKPGELRILKVEQNSDGSSGTVIEGVTFKITKQEEELDKKIYINGDVVGDSFEITTDENGIAKKEKIGVGKYYIEEINAPIRYEISKEKIPFKIVSDAIEGVKVEVKNELKKGDIEVLKEWKDASGNTLENTDEIPEKIKVDLYKNGVKTDRTIVLSEDSHWKGTFDNLDLYDENNKEIFYTVVEEEVKGYKSEVSGTAKDGFVVTNTEETPLIPLEPAKTSVKVRKEWVGKAKDSVRINLLADGTKIDSVELSKENNWEHEFTDLDVQEDLSSEKAIEYTVVEEEVKGYKSEVSGTAEEGFLVTNTEIKEDPKPTEPKEPETLEPAKTSVKVRKEWVGKAKDSVTINLLADGTKIDSVELSEENNWEYEFTDLDVQEDLSSEKTIKYTVKEVVVEGYESEVSGTAEGGFVVTNTEIKEDPKPTEPKEPESPAPVEPVKPVDPTEPEEPEVPEPVEPSEPEEPEVPEPVEPSEPEEPGLLDPIVPDEPSVVEPEEDDDTGVLGEQNKDEEDEDEDQKPIIIVPEDKEDEEKPNEIVLGKVDNNNSNTPNISNTSTAPMTGDKGVLAYSLLALLSLVAVVFARKKEVVK